MSPPDRPSPARKPPAATARRTRKKAAPAAEATSPPAEVSTVPAEATTMPGATNAAPAKATAVRAQANTVGAQANTVGAEANTVGADANTQPIGSNTLPADGRARVVIEAITPSVDNGRFAAKAVVGDHVVVEADCFADGHDVIACVLRYRRDEGAEQAWREAPMTALGNDRWRGHFVAQSIGRYRFGITAWVDGFLSWHHDFERRVDPADIELAARVGAELIDAASHRAAGTSAEDAAQLARWALRLRTEDDVTALREDALDEDLAAIAMRYPDRTLATTYPIEFPLFADRERARFSAWYELFPRSFAATPGEQGTLRDCIRMLPYVAGMGFDVLYLPPIHPIGRTQRKGRNNALVTTAHDVGSPWAIGAAEGGHKALHPQLGTLEDFRALIAAAQEHGLEIALDIAFQTAPDHPYVAAHPEWFRWRPDGTVQYAENPPK